MCVCIDTLYLCCMCACVCLCVCVCVCVCVSIIIPCVYYNTNIMNVCIIIMNVGIYDLINFNYIYYLCVRVCVWCVCA